MTKFEIGDYCILSNGSEDDVYEIVDIIQSDNPRREAMFQVKHLRGDSHYPEKIVPERDVMAPNPLVSLALEAKDDL